MAIQKICLGRKLLIYIALFLLSLLCYAAEMRDPTRPVSYAEEISATADNPDALILNEILSSTFRQVAVINDTALAVGELESGIKLLSIDPSNGTVHIMKDQKEMVLALPKLDKIEGVH